MRRIKDGFRLLGQSWKVIRREPALVGVMALGVLAMVVVAAALYLLVFRRMPEAGDFRWPGILWLYPIVLVAGIPSTIAGSTVIAAAMQSIEGKDVSLRAGLALTLSRLPQLIGWSLISAVVGLFIQLVAEKLKLGGRIAVGLAGVSWAVATMLVIPVLLFEGRGPFESVRRSAQLIKKRWGEGVTGYGSIAGAMLLVMLPLVVVGSALVVVDVALGVAALTVAILGSLFLITTLGGVFNAALYRFAVAGAAAGPFGEEQLESTFVSKEKERKPARRALRIAGAVLLGIYAVIKLLEWTDVIQIPGG